MLLPCPEDSEIPGGEAIAERPEVSTLDWIEACRVFAHQAQPGAVGGIRERHHDAVQSHAGSLDGCRKHDQPIVFAKCIASLNRQFCVGPDGRIPGSDAV
jgi:hypothetical protein